MKHKYYPRLLSMALALSFAITSCGDDDPITPTPDPEPTPDPKPSVTYNGYGCSFSLDSIAGEENTFNTMLLDTMAFYCPELEEVSSNTYAASIVYTEDDKTQYETLKSNFGNFKKSVMEWHKILKSPIVTTISTFKTTSASNVSSDWSFSAGSVQSSSVGGILLPYLSQEIWATTDAKESGVESVQFGRWHKSESVKAMCNGSVILNGSDTYNASRQGAFILLFNNEDKIAYGFQILSGGESMRLIRINDQTLEETAMPTYQFASLKE